MEKKLVFNKKVGILSGLLVGTLAFVGMKVGYAVNFDSDGFPTSDFRTNVAENVSTINYVCSSATCVNSGNGLITSDFEVRNIGINGSSPVVPLYITSKNMIKKDSESNKFVGFPTSSEVISLDQNISNPNPTAVNDNGLKYILRYGYNGKNSGRSIFDKLKNTSGYGSVTDAEKYYITQIAIWLYLNGKSSSFSNYCSSSRCSFTTSSTNLNNTFKTSSDKKIIKYIAKLVEDANSYNGNTSGNSYTYSVTDKYVLSDDGKTLFYGPINLTVNDAQRFVNWKATVTQPTSYPNTIDIVNENGTVVTDLNNLPNTIKFAIHLYDNNGNFKENLNLTTANVKFTFTTFDDKASDVIVKDYRVTGTDRGGEILLPDSGDKTDVFSKVLMGINKSSSSDENVPLTNITVVEKIITGTKSKLAGAELSLYNLSDIEVVDGKAKPKASAQAIASWISSATKGKEFKLAAGDYYVCEVTAPTGYKDLPAGCVKFTVKNNAVTLYALENTPAPDTGLFKSYTPYVIGGILILLGSTGFIVINIKKKKESV